MKYGIDVAKWNGTVDWAKVRASNMAFAVLKVTNKNNEVEEAFEQNYSGATEQGIVVGAYRYVYAKQLKQRKVEANAIVKALSGKKINFRVWLDMEADSIKNIGKSRLTEIINAEADIIQAAGFQVGIYCNTDWYKNVLDSASLKVVFRSGLLGTERTAEKCRRSILQNHMRSHGSTHHKDHVMVFRKGRS